MLKSSPQMLAKHNINKMEKNDITITTIELSWLTGCISQQGQKKDFG